MSSFQEKQRVLSLFTRTWVRDSHGLYDYESPQTKNINVMIAESVLIARTKHEIQTVPINKALNNDQELILNVTYQNNDIYSIENPITFMMQPSEENIINLSNKIWYVLKSEDTQNSTNLQTINNINEDYNLCKNDIIKLGRVKYALNDVHIPDRKDIIDIETPLDPLSYNVESINMNSQSVFDFIFLAKNELGNNEENICKICYSDSNENDNPLVHLCSCSGGIRFAHYFCIKKWMETKLIIKENEKKTVKSYNIKSFNCEICKTPYPYRFKLEGKEEIFNLIDIEKPNCNYIIFESLNQVKDNCNIKSIHVIQLTGDVIKIGRGHESDVRINDISVSRVHALLKYDKVSGRLLIRNLKSKFGTLVLLKRPLIIKDKKIDLQVGRTFIEAGLISKKEFERLKKEKKNKTLEKEFLKKNTQIKQFVDKGNEGNLNLNNNNNNNINENNNNNNGSFGGIS